MYILNYILLASGVLFVIAMTLICLGLFLGPRRRNTAPEAFEEYAAPAARSGRHIIDVSDDYDEDTEEGTEYDEPIGDDTDDAENDDDLSESKSEITDEITDKADKAADSEEAENNIDNEKDLSAKHAAINGIEVTVTVIDTNKKHTIAVKDEIIIGRNPKCDVIINKPMVSSAHCILIRDGKKLMAEDNNSTNGTMLNGKPLNHMVELKNNDVLTLGDRSIRINFV